MRKRFKSKQLLMMVIGCLTLGACKDQPQKVQNNSYAMLTVEPTDRVLMSNYSATIQGRQDIDIYPQVMGFITKVCVNEGSVVRKGETLFVIDQVAYQAALRTAEANVAAANASVATAELNYKSKKELFDAKVVAEYDLMTAENALKSSQAQLAQMQAQEVNARNNLSFTVVKSPSDGVVGKLPYRVGALVSASIPKALTTVSDNSQMFVYFSMNEKQVLELLRKYGSVENALKEMPSVKLQLSDGSIYTEEGRVEAISGVIDQTTGSVAFRAVFPNSDRILLSGASGNVVMPFSHENTIVIPRAATFELQDKIFVYKVVDGVAKSESVTVAKLSDGKEYIVESGLQAGDVIVAEGAGLLREGTPVQPKQSVKE